MGLLDSKSQKCLVESMRNALISSVKSDKTLTESAKVGGVKFVTESATYEQLLNMTLNPICESKYLPTHVLEGAVAIVSEAMLSGRKVIGVNALTEGAMKLVKKTDCVITESMMEAADNLAKSKGLGIVAKAITEGWLSNVTKAIGKAIAGSGGKAEKGLGAVKKGIKKGIKAVKKSDAYKAASKKVNKAVDSVSDAAKKAGKAVEKKASEVKGKVEKTITTHKNKAKMKKVRAAKAAKAKAAKEQADRIARAPKGPFNESVNVISAWYKKNAK